MSAVVDINCDMGESFGCYTLGSDAECMPHISSANIACGFHAGDSRTMRETVERAVAAGVSIGAHPGLPDLQGFGRRPMAMSPDEIHDIVLHQLGALGAFCKAAGTVVAHVKPHGALSHMASADMEIARAIARAAASYDPAMLVYSPTGSRIGLAAEEFGLKPVSEVYADRTYQDNGLLTPRSRPDALITDVDQAIDQVSMMVLEGVVISTDGNRVPVLAESVCVHGDGAHAVEFAARLRERLEARGVAIAAPARSAEGA